MNEQTITTGEAIHRIEQIYHANYDPHSDLSVWEQLEICESITPAAEELRKERNTNDSVNISGNGNDTCKRSANFELKERKRKAISELKTLDYKTPPIKISQLLETIFVEYNSKKGHWLFISQNYNPRAINRVLDYMIKAHTTGKKTIQNPAAYFTSLIKYRKKRRSL